MLMPKKPPKRGPVKFVVKRPPSLFKVPRPVHNGISKFVVATVSRMLAEGVPLRLAAQAAGITAKRIEKWMERGELVAKSLEDTLDYPDDCTAECLLYHDLYCAVSKEVAKSAVHAIKKVRSGMGHDWRAAAWWLDRKVEGFSKPTPGVGGNVGPNNAPPVQVIIYEPPNARGPSVG